jgi:hypothetical protein
MKPILLTNVLEKKIQKKSKLVGWSLTDITKQQIQNIAAKFRIKNVKVVRKIFNILFNELAEDKDFRYFVEMYDTLQGREVSTKTSIYSSYVISNGDMKKFRDTMYDFNFVERSPFFRIVIDYIYQKNCKPITGIMNKIENNLKGQGYKVKNITPALMGDIFIQVENLQETGRK